MTSKIQMFSICYTFLSKSPAEEFPIYRFLDMDHFIPRAIQDRGKYLLLKLFYADPSNTKQFKYWHWSCKVLPRRASPEHSKRSSPSLRRHTKALSSSPPVTASVLVLGSRLTQKTDARGNKQNYVSDRSQTYLSHTLTVLLWASKQEEPKGSEMQNLPPSKCHH